MPECGSDGKKEGSTEYIDPVAAYPAHMAPKIVYTGNLFPAKYKNGAFIDFHGSRNRGPEPQPVHYVIFHPFGNGQPYGDWEVLLMAFQDHLNQPHRVVQIIADMA